MEGHWWIGGGGVEAGTRPSSFIFMQFLGKIWTNNRLAPPPGDWCPFLWEILDPLLEGESKTSFPGKKLESKQFLNKYIVFCH